MAPRTHPVRIYLEAFPVGDGSKWQIRYRPHYSKDWADYGKLTKKGTATTFVGTYKSGSYRRAQDREKFEMFEKHLDRKFVYWSVEGQC